MILSFLQPFYEDSALPKVELMYFPSTLCVFPIVIMGTSQSWTSVIPLFIEYTSSNFLRVLSKTEGLHFSEKEYVLPVALLFIDVVA
jgi:hypothetical protein